MKTDWRQLILKQREIFQEPTYEAWRCVKCHKHINPLDVYELDENLQPVCDNCHAKARLSGIVPLDKMYTE